MHTDEDADVIRVHAWLFSSTLFTAFRTSSKLMREAYLDVTSRHGRAIAAYYYLPREAGQKSVRTRRVEPGLIIDYAGEGRAIGIEITAPSKVSLAALNAVLDELGHSRASQADLSPRIAA